MKKKLIIILVVLILATVLYAADVKWSAMPANTTIADNDWALIIDTGTGVSQKITVLNFFDTIDTFAELQAITADLTLVNEEAAWTFDDIITFSTAITFSDAATIDQSANNYIDFAENADTILFYYNATDLGIIWSDGALNLQNAEDGVNAIVNIIGKDAGEYGILRILSDGDDKYIELYNDDTDAVLTNSAGNIILNPVGLGIVIGDNGDEDYTLTFDGDTSNGILNYDEDNADFEFDQDVITTGVFYAPAFDAVGAEDMDYGSADITDHTFTTDDSTFIIDGGITVSTGDNITLGVVQWNSADEIDGTKIKDADYGDVDVSAGGAWTLDTDSVGDNEIDYTAVTGADLTLTDAGAITSTGTITATVGFDIVGAADIDYGSADVTDHTFLSDGTGTGEFVLKAGAIDSTEILDGTVTEIDLNVTNAPGAGEDNYVLTYNHAGTNMTWAVDAGAGTTAYDDIGDPDAAGSISFDAAEGATYTSSDDQWVGVTISNTQADNVGDTELLTLAFTDDGDTNSHYLIMSDAAGTQQLEVIQSTADIQITTAGDLKFIAGGGDFTFDDDNITTTGTIEGATLTEGGNAVYSSGETPSGELGGTFANISVDSTHAGSAHHAESHNVASHNDTTGTGTELDTLTDNSIADTLHRHTELVASDGTPDPALSVDATGRVGIGTSDPEGTLELRTGNSVIRIRDTGDTATATTSFVEFGGTTAAAFSRTGYIGDSQVANTDIILQAEQSDLRLGDSTSESVLTLSGGDVTATGALEAATLTEGGVAVYNDNEIDEFSEIDAIVADKSLVNFEDGGTFTGGLIANANLSVGNATTTAGVLTLLEDDDDGANFASFMVPALAANTVYTLPPDDGDNTEVLQTNGSGTLTWVANAGGGAVAWDDISDPDNSGLTTITFDNAEATLFTGDNDAAVSFMTIQNSDADHTGGNMYLLDLDYSADDGDVDADFIKFQDSGSVVMTIQQNGDIATDGGITAGGTVEGATLTEGGIAVHNNDEMDASSELAAIFDDETGSSGGGVIVFNLGPTFSSNAKISRSSDTATSGPYMSMERDRDGDPTRNVSIGDYLGKYAFYGYHTSNYYKAAEIRAIVDGTPGDVDMPGRLEFLTTPDGTNTPVIRMVIDNAGNIKMGDGAWTNYTNVSINGTITPTGTADLELPQASPAVPDADGEVELDFTDGKMVIQHGAAHAELGGSTDVVMGSLIKSWSGTIFAPDGINDVMTVKAINSIEFPHGVVITAIYLGVSENSNYTLTFQNFDDFDTINAGNPTIDAVAYTADTTGEIIDTTPTYATIAAGQIIMISIPVTNVDWINFCIYYYEPAA